MSLDRLVLVLNASYEPINITSARRAIKLVLKGTAAPEDSSAYSIRTPLGEIQFSTVIRLKRYRRVPRMSRVVTRKGIILRDGSTCQYCRRKLAPQELTLDHVIPQSRSGPFTWENLVASCKPCNNRKGDRTPEEAGMTLLRPPHQINIHAKYRMLSGDDAAWRRYLFC